MFGIFRRRRQSATTGVDIDTTFASLLELSSHGDRFHVESYIRENIFLEENHTAMDRETGDAIDPAILGASLEKLVNKGRISSKKAISAVPVSSVITKQLLLDASLNDDEMESQVVLEAEQVIPYPIEEVALDFEVIGENSQNPDKVDVQLVACRKKTVDSQENILLLAGFQPQVIDIVSNAMERAYTLVEPQLKLPDQTNNIALIDIGDTAITLNILKDRSSSYVRSQFFGTGQLLELASREMQCTHKEALQSCMQGTLDKNIISSFCRQGVTQINRMLEQFYSAEHISGVDHILVSGSLPIMDHFYSVFSEKTDITCSLANPFINMTFSSRVNEVALKEVAPAFFIACGLAMRSDV